MKYSLTRPTPRNMRYAQCQLCGFRQHIKDLKKVMDKHNRHYGMLICRSHKDNTNPQDIPYKKKEKLVGYIDKINPVSYTYVTNENDDRLPGKPTNGFTVSDPLSGEITLRWDAPTDNGSSPINGYAIKYSNPQRIHYEVLITNTNSSVPYYKDIDSDPDDFISYRVAAINGFGQGEYSDEFYWPIDMFASTLLNGSSYLATKNLDNTYSYVVTDTGDYILL